MKSKWCFCLRASRAKCLLFLKIVKIWITKVSEWSRLTWRTWGQSWWKGWGLELTAARAGAGAPPGWWSQLRCAPGSWRPHSRLSSNTQIFRYKKNITSKFSFYSTRKIYRCNVYDREGCCINYVTSIDALLYLPNENTGHVTCYSHILLFILFHYNYDMSSAQAHYTPIIWIMMKLSLLLFSFSFIFIISSISSKRFIVKTKHGDQFQAETRKQTKGLFRCNKDLPSNKETYILLLFFQLKWNDRMIQEED